MGDRYCLYMPVHLKGWHWKTAGGTVFNEHCCKIRALVYQGSKHFDVINEKLTFIKTFELEYDFRLADVKIYDIVPDLNNFSFLRSENVAPYRQLVHLKKTVVRCLVGFTSAQNTTANNF